MDERGSMLYTTYERRTAQTTVQVKSESAADLLTSAVQVMTEHRTRAMLQVANATPKAKTFYLHCVQVFECAEKLFMSELYIAMEQTGAEAIDAASALPAPSPLSALSNREKDVARLVARGLINLEIARELKITETTVEAHMQHIFGKLNIHKRVELARIMQAATNGTLQLETSRR